MAACVAARDQPRTSVIDAAVTASNQLPAPRKSLLLRLERTACLGWCPRYIVEVDTDGSIRYVGTANVLTVGSTSGRLTPSAMAELRSAIDDAHLMTLAANCCDCFDFTDAPSVMITVADRSDPKTIRDYHGCGATPKLIRDLEDDLDRIMGTEKWIGTDEQRTTCFVEGGACPTPR